MTNGAQQNAGKVQGGVANLTNAGKGRKKGVPNKATTAIKDMIVQALAEEGGVDYLRQQAQENPTAFLSLVGKVIPLQVNHSGEVGIADIILERRERASQSANPYVPAYN